ncbi:MAG: glucuronate isomerase [Tabrizicola sp.]|nr:glucuronate isomerase [Tabrizicola sp.]
MSPPRAAPRSFLAAGPGDRSIARRLYSAVARAPIISPHGHTHARWFASNAPFADATSVLLWPDHYLLRMLYSQGIGFDALGLADHGKTPREADRRKVWQLFAANYHLFRGTPSRWWLDHVFAEVFGLELALEAQTAEHYYDAIGAALARPEFLPRALFERFGIEVLATTEGATEALLHHETIAREWGRRVITTFRPDDVVDPEREDFPDNLRSLAAITGQDVESWSGYLRALRLRRAEFRAHGATATDHGHPTALTADLRDARAEQLFRRVTQGRASAADAELFRAQMLTEMARMSIEDGLVMQLHPGSVRNHSTAILARFGRDKGFDIPAPVDYVHALRPLLEAHGMDNRLRLIVFTLDETTYARELAPMAGAYPALKIGPAWWFFDSPEGMRRYREAVTETAGFYNTVGFNDDTRAFCSIPARHDVARRVDCAYLATLVATGRLAEADAHEVAHDLAYRLAKEAYRL